MTKGSCPFRLDVLAVIHFVDKLNCLIRDPSEERTDPILEGVVEPFSAHFTLLSCGVYGPPAQADFNEILLTISGNITCNLSKPVAGKASTNNTYNFSFNNLQLK